MIVYHTYIVLYLCHLLLYVCYYAHNCKLLLSLCNINIAHHAVAPARGTTTPPSSGRIVQAAPGRNSLLLRRQLCCQRIFCNTVNTGWPLSNVSTQRMQEDVLRNKVYFEEIIPDLECSFPTLRVGSHRLYKPSNGQNIISSYPKLSI